MSFIYLFFSFMLSPLPEIILPKNQWISLSQTHFRYATNGQEAPQSTLVKLKADDDYLYIDFECQQNPYWNQNSYKEHNSEMWNRKYLNCLLPPGEDTPIHYLELEINPNNALFVGWIDNPTKEAPQKLTFVPYKEAKIKHEVKTLENQWSGQMQIPWALLGGKKNTYRLNFYRIVSLTSYPS
ncbi:MAG: carbohydrate-binding family 9-like protein [Spirosomataceae bacterium]